MACRFDTCYEIAQSRDADVAECFDRVVIYSFTTETFPTFFFVKQAHELHGLLIVNGGDEIRISYVVDPRNVLVADTFDAMLTEAELQQGGALQCFGRDNADTRVLRAQVVACRYGPGRTGSTNVTG